MYQPIEIFMEIFNNIEWGYDRKWRYRVSQNMVNTASPFTPRGFDPSLLGALKWEKSPNNGPFSMVNNSDEPLEYEVMLGNRKPSPKFQCLI